MKTTWSPAKSLIENKISERNKLTHNGGVRTSRYPLYDIEMVSGTVDNIVGRLRRVCSEEQIDLIIGSLLGDARLECRSIGVKYPVSARLRIHQSDRQKDYVFWKYESLKNLVLKEPRRVKAWHDPKRDKDHFSWYFHTKTVPEFGEIHHYFYRNKIKILPSHIFDFLNQRALAIWFMDDGSNIGSGLTISTHCFKFADQKRIVAFLKEKYGISTSIIKDRKKFKIYIGKHEAKNFIEIVRPFIIPSMEYKIVIPVTTSLNNQRELRNATSSFLS